MCCKLGTFTIFLFPESKTNERRQSKALVSFGTTVSRLMQFAFTFQFPILKVCLKDFASFYAPGGFLWFRLPLLSLRFIKKFFVIRSAEFVATNLWLNREVIPRSVLMEFRERWLSANVAGYIASLLCYQAIEIRLHKGNKSISAHQFLCLF